MQIASGTCSGCITSKPEVMVLEVVHRWLTLVCLHLQREARTEQDNSSSEAPRSAGKIIPGQNQRRDKPRAGVALPDNFHLTGFRQVTIHDSGSASGSHARSPWDQVDVAL